VSRSIEPAVRALAAGARESRDIGDATGTRIRAAGRTPELVDLERRLSAIATRSTPHADQEIALLACHEALAAIGEGNYGVGAVLIDPSGAVAERGHNLAFQPTFRSDLHAEMVVMNAFEERFPETGSMAGYVLVCSLEPCPMCLARLLIAGVETVKFVASDELGGMVEGLHHLPLAWKRLAERVEFRRADTSDELRRLAADAFLLNLDRLRRRLWAR
jgi:cytosine deaminase